MSRRRAEIGARRILPLEYQQVEYLESTGEQWIDTLFKPNNNTGLDIDFKYLDFSSSTKMFYGAAQSGWANKAYGCCTYSARQQFYCYANSDEYINLTATQNTRYQVNRNRNIVTFISNNTTLITKTLSSSVFQCPYNLYLFCTNWTNVATHKSSIMMFSCKMRDDDSLIRDFIPAYRISDNKPCMYDLVTRQPFFNQGSGEFTVGPAIY